MKISKIKVYETYLEREKNDTESLGRYLDKIHASVLFSDFACFCPWLPTFRHLFAHFSSFPCARLQVTSKQLSDPSRTLKPREFRCKFTKPPPTTDFQHSLIRNPRRSSSTPLLFPQADSAHWLRSHLTYFFVKKATGENGR